MTFTRRPWGYLQLIIILAALCAGCAEQPPTEAVSQAEKAVADARTQEADLYAREPYLKAEEALKKTRAFMTERKFGEAKTAANEATGFAREAASQVEGAKVKMKADADQLAKEVQVGITDLKSLLAATARKGGADDVQTLKMAIKQMEVDLINARVRLETGKLRQGYDELVALKKQASGHKTDLSPSTPKT